ncbi:hypothetical protein [Rhizobium ruizarguesonis]|uniref:hypothetical protein n=1 Tax=Rhizobium ruizarguesonis TaxID=2081791 RepID=UPI0013BBEE6F|nr:hypothetical protein [Rhizobium ruizarguesonis]NEJ57509.1 hypothetical protein [Rhizobium ruizarguesonis]NEJ64926.1 hypothetical protein [Rhizobium ruizarguesonis]
MAYHSLYGRKFGIEPASGALVSDDGTKTATATGTGATSTATLSKTQGKVTTAALTTAAAATHVMTLTNSKIAATDTVLVTVGKGTATTGTPKVADVTPGAGSVIITIQNIAAAAAINGTLIVGFLVMKA